MQARQFIKQLCTWIKSRGRPWCMDIQAELKLAKEIISGINWKENQEIAWTKKRNARVAWRNVGLFSVLVRHLEWVSCASHSRESDLKGHAEREKDGVVKILHEKTFCSDSCVRFCFQCRVSPCWQGSWSERCREAFSHWVKYTLGSSEYQPENRRNSAHLKHHQRNKRSIGALGRHSGSEQRHLQSQ